MSDNLIERISTALESEYTLEGLVRQLLEMLELVTNMESTYLTRIEPDGSFQHILFARNSRHMQIPEGLCVPWGDTLCKRALDEGKRYTSDVANVWGDSKAANWLSIRLAGMKCPGRASTRFSASAADSSRKTNTSPGMAWRRVSR